MHREVHLGKDAMIPAAFPHHMTFALHDGVTPRECSSPVGSPRHLEKPWFALYALHPETGTKPIRIAPIHSNDVGDEQPDCCEEPFLLFSGEATEIPHERRRPFVCRHFA